MSLKDEITKAVSGHGMWKSRLLMAIEDGKSEFVPDQVRHDDRCDFGRWLYGATLDSTVKKAPDYEACRRLHAEFHSEAARVLTFATTGQKEKAIAAMKPNSKYSEISSSLTKAMMDWKNKAS